MFFFHFGVFGINYVLLRSCEFTASVEEYEDSVSKLILEGTNTKLNVIYNLKDLLWGSYRIYVDGNG
jgi:hypothetical protein